MKENFKKIKSIRQVKIDNSYDFPVKISIE